MTQRVLRLTFDVSSRECTSHDKLREGAIFLASAQGRTKELLLQGRSPMHCQQEL